MGEPTSKYPRGRPYKPAAPEPDAFPVPPETTVRRTGPTISPDAQLRAWTLRMAIGIVGSVALVAGIAVIAGVIASKPKATVAAVEPPVKPAPVTRPVSTVAVTRPAPATKAREPEEEEPVVPKAKLPIAQPDKAIPADPEKAKVTLQAVANLTVANLYQTYLSLGLLADGSENGLYTDEEAQKMLGVVLALIENVDQQLLNLSRGGMEREDHKQVQRFRGLADLLRTQATELRAYWNTSEKDKEARKDHETKFHQTRKEAWTGLKELLGIKEEE